MYSRTLLDILFLIWGQTVADYKMLSFHLSINVIIIVVSFKILDLCPIALFQQLWNTPYVVKIPFWKLPCVCTIFCFLQKLRKLRILIVPAKCKCMWWKSASCESWVVAFHSNHRELGPVDWPKIVTYRLQGGGPLLRYAWKALQRSNNYFFAI